MTIMSLAGARSSARFHQEIPPMRVQLTKGEYLWAAQVGVMRHIKALTNGSKPGYGIKGLGWNEAILGAIGELAFSKAMNMHWSNMLTDTPNRRPDVGGYEVKTVSESTHRLVVRKNTPDNVKVALVVVDGFECEIAGWINGADAKALGDYQSYQGREPQYYLDRTHLTPFTGDVT